MAPNPSQEPNFLGNFYEQSYIRLYYSGRPPLEFNQK